MNELTERCLPRLGVVTLAIMLMVMSILLVGPLDDVGWGWAVIAVFATMGFGLIARARFARVIAGLACVTGLVLSVPAIYEMWSRVEIDDLDVTTVLALANSIATTLLGLWLGVRALLVILGRARTTTLTARLVGGTIVVVAANHLWLAYLYGFSWRGGFSISLATEGTRFLGFPGWPLWHVGALLAGLVLVAGPRRSITPASTALMGLSFLLVPLMCVAEMSDHLVDVPLFMFMSAMTLLVAYLAWWLRTEARLQTRYGIGAAIAMNG